MLITDTNLVYDIRGIVHPSNMQTFPKQTNNTEVESGLYGMWSPDRRIENRILNRVIPRVLALSTPPPSKSYMFVRVLADI